MMLPTLVLVILCSSATCSHAGTRGMSLLAVESEAAVPPEPDPRSVSTGSAAAVATPEPDKAHVGTIEQFVRLMNESPSRVGEKRGQEAWNTLKYMGDARGIFEGYAPAHMGYFDGRNGVRYIYTTEKCWVDMLHFLFYAGRAAMFKDMPAPRMYVTQGGIVHGGRKPDPIQAALREGFTQESFDGRGSSFSYEDLSSDRLGAEFAIHHFRADSDETLAQQVERFMRQIGATDPRSAPNYDRIPDNYDPDRPPTWTSKSTDPYCRFD